MSDTEGVKDITQDAETNVANLDVLYAAVILFPSMFEEDLVRTAVEWYLLEPEQREEALIRAAAKADGI